MIKRYQQFIKESSNSYATFGIKYDDLSDILFYITDEFPELEWWADNSLQSSLVEKDDNCFIVTFNRKDIDFPNDLPVLHYIEPKIFELIKDVDSQLRGRGLYVYASDFGENDAYYELVISRIGHKPTDKKRGW